MANQNAFLVSIYGMNSQAQGTNQGRIMSFPSTAVLVRPVIPDSTFDGTFSGVTMNAIIQLLPSGTVVNQPQWYSPLTVTQVNTLQNT
jgi:hypothetical protein